jgi:hypothetical protein
MKKLYRLNIDEVLANLSLFTVCDIGGEGHGIIVEEDDVNEAIDEITDNFKQLVAESFNLYEEEE